MKVLSIVMFSSSNYWRVLLNLPYLVMIWDLESSGKILRIGHINDRRTHEVIVSEYFIIKGTNSTFFKTFNNISMPKSRWELFTDQFWNFINKVRFPWIIYHLIISSFVLKDLKEKAGIHINRLKLVAIVCLNCQYNYLVFSAVIHDINTNARLMVIVNKHLSMK